MTHTEKPFDPTAEGACAGSEVVGLSPASEPRFPTCSTCKWWLAYATGERGECRKAPPMVRREAYQSQWPITTARDFCGGYKPQGFTEGPRAIAASRAEEPQ